MTMDKFYDQLPTELMAELDARTVPDAGYERLDVLACISARYFDLLNRGRRNLASLFVENELGFMADICNASVIDDTFIELFAFRVEDAAQDYGLKWEVDSAVLLQKIRSLDRAAMYALVDGIERFWSKRSRGEDTTPADIVEPQQTLAESGPHQGLKAYTSRPSR